jgi:hypothetical protein
MNAFWNERVTGGFGRLDQPVKRAFRLRSGREVLMSSGQVLPFYPTDLPGDFRFYFPAHDVIKSIGDAHKQVLAITRIKVWQQTSYFENIEAVQKNVDKMFKKKGSIEKVFARTDYGRRYGRRGTPQADANQQLTKFIDDIVLLIFQRWARGEPTWALCSNDAALPLDDAMKEMEAYSRLMRRGMGEVILDPASRGRTDAQKTAIVQAKVYEWRGSTAPQPSMFVMRFPPFNPLRHPPFMHT